MQLASPATPLFRVTAQTARTPFLGGGAGRTSSVQLGTDSTWTATNQGFGNPPKTGALDAKLGASLLAATTAFLATDPAPASDATKGSLTITQAGSTAAYALGTTAADALVAQVFGAANTVKY